MIDKVKELDKIMRTLILQCCSVDSNNVRNALSKHGERFDKRKEEQIYESYSTSDIIIFFERVLRDTSSDVNFEDSSLVSYRSYSYKINIYGDECDEVANEIISKIQSQASRFYLNSHNIYLEGISGSISINEFVNDTMWLRCTFDIDITTERSVDHSSDPSIQSTDFKIIGG